MKLRDLIEENNSFPTDLSVKKTHDVINGDQTILKYNDGNVFGQTTQDERGEVFYTRSKKERDLVKSVGKNNFIKLLNKYYKLNVKDVL